MSLTGALILGGLGAGTNLIKGKQQQKQQDINNNLQAEIESTSWATGRNGRPSFNAQNPYTAMLDGGLQGAVSGYAQGQSMENAEAKRNLLNAMASSYGPSQSIYSQMMPSMQLQKGFNY